MKRGCKKGQVTIFVIIAILIVLAVLLVLFWKDISGALHLGPSSQVQSVQDELQNCVAQTAKDSIRIISLQGGYVLPEPYFIQNIYHVAYWLNNSRDISPSLDTISRELEWTMNDLLPACVYMINFSKYSIENFTTGSISSRVTISDDLVLFDVQYSISMAIADKFYNFRQFSDKEDVRLGKIYKLSRDIVTRQLKDGINVCLSCLSDIGFNNDLFVELNSLEGDSVVPRIIDNTTKIFEPDPYIFTFAMKVK